MEPINEAIIREMDRYGELLKDHYKKVRLDKETDIKNVLGKVILKTTDFEMAHRIMLLEKVDQASLQRVLGGIDYYRIKIIAEIFVAVENELREMGIKE